MFTVVSAMLLVGLTADAMSYARRSYELERTGDLAGAEQQIREAIRVEPGTALFHSALSGVLVQSGRGLDALTELQAALDCKPGEPVRAQLLARLEQLSVASAAELVASGKFRDGLPLAQQAVARLPRSAAMWQMLGYFQAKLRLHRDAVESYRQALAIDGHSADAALGLAIAQADAGLTTEAVRSLETGMQHFPQDPRFPQALGNTLLANADPSEIARASELFRKALALDPALSESHYQLGSLALQQGKYSDAAEHLSAALALSANDSRIHFALARLYRALHKDADAQREMALFLKNSKPVPVP